MKITIVCDILGKKNNGTSIAAYNLINYLKNKGHIVKVLCCDCDKSGDDDFIVLDKLNLGILNKILDKNGISLPKTDKKIIRDALIDCDIVHIMLPFPMGKKACKLAKKLGKPVTAGFHCQAELVTSHFGLMNATLVNKYVYKNFYNSFYKKCDAIHYPTSFIRDTFENVAGKTNGYIISNGVNNEITFKEVEKPEEFKGKFVILTTGRLCKEKSHDVLLKAIAHSKYNDKIQLIIAGQGPLFNKIKNYGNKHLNNPPIIKYFSRKEMIDILNFADLYCHPAEVELEGIACLEACVCGLVPIVSDSNRAATKNFALTENNIFKNRDYNDLKNKIEFFIEHPDEKLLIKGQYLNYGKTFDLDSCMAKMEEMFEEVLNSSRK